MLDKMYYKHSTFATFLNINQKLLISEEFIFGNFVKYLKKSEIYASIFISSKSRIIETFFVRPVCCRNGGKFSQNGSIRSSLKRMEGAPALN